MILQIYQSQNYSKKAVLHNLGHGRNNLSSQILNLQITLLCLFMKVLRKLKKILKKWFSYI